MEERFVSLESLGGGAAIEMFQDEFDKVLANVLDPNTKATAARSVTLTVTIKPDENRRYGNTLIECKSKIASIRGVGTALYIGRAGGKPVATERDDKQMEIPGNVVGIKEASGGK